MRAASVIGTCCQHSPTEDLLVPLEGTEVNTG